MPESNKEIRLDGFIGDFDNTVEGFVFRIAEAGISPDDDFTVSINSFGGSVFDGWGIFNYIKNHRGKVTTRIDGVAASIASVIALAGDQIQMSEIATFMIHKASLFTEGNSEDLREAIEILEKIDATLVNLYVARSGKEREEVEELLLNETWFTSSEALAAGFVDEIVNKIDVQKVAAQYSFNNNSKTMSKEQKSKLDQFLAKWGLAPKNTAEDEAAAAAEAAKAAEEAAAQEEGALEVKNVEVPEEALQELIGMIQSLMQSQEEAEDKAEQLDNKIQELEEKLPDEAKIAESVEDAIVEKLENVVSFEKPARAQGNLGQLGGKGSKISQAKIGREIMKEIDAKTRQ